MTPAVRVRVLTAAAVGAVVGIAAAPASQRGRLLLTIGAAAVLLLAGLGLVSVVSQLRLWWVRREIRRLP